MARVSLETFGTLVVEHRRRTKLGVRAAAAAAGVKPSTLSRVENGYLPDLNHFRKLCEWIQVDPSEVLGVRSPPPQGTDSPPPTLRVHFKKKTTVTQETARALGDLMMAADKALELQKNL